MIIRTEHKKEKGEFYIAYKAAAQDTRLSWAARGMLHYLFSRPDNWQVRPDDLLNQGPDGREKNRNILKELAQVGYLKRIKTRGDDGKFTWQSVLYEWVDPESPLQAIPSTDGFMVDGETAPQAIQATDHKTIDGSTIDGLTTDGFMVDIVSNESNKQLKRKKLDSFSYDFEEVVNNYKFKIDRIPSMGNINQLEAWLKTIETPPGETARQWIEAAIDSSVIAQVFTFEHVAKVMKGIREAGGAAAYQISPLRRLWSGLLDQLKSELTNAQYSHFIYSDPVGVTDKGDLLIQVETDRAKDWIENRLNTMVQRTVKNYSDYDKVVFISAEGGQK